MRDSTRARTVGWTALTGVSLLAALIALASAARPAAEAAPAFRLRASVPAPVLAVAAVAVTLAASVAVALALSRAKQPRRLDEDEEEQPASRIPRWLRPILSLLALAPYVLLALYLARAGGSLPDLLARLGFGLDPSSLGLPSGPEVPMSASALYTGLLAALILVATLGSLMLMLWVVLGTRVAEWWARPEPEAVRPPAPVVTAVEESLDDLEREPDARAAIIRCYRRFERALAEAGTPRAPWLTPLEFMRQALGRLALPAGAVGTMTALFERSRFSDEPVGAGERRTALDALREIEARLVSEVPDGAA
jgi:hypothetical protein